MNKKKKGLKFDIIFKKIMASLYKRLGEIKKKRRLGLDNKTD